jgi:hypothetical protein
VTKKTALTAAEEAYRTWLYGSRRYNLPQPGTVLIYPRGVPVLSGDAMAWETTGQGLAIDGKRYVQVRSTAPWLQTPHIHLMDERALPELRALQEKRAKIKSTKPQEPTTGGTG